MRALAAALLWLAGSASAQTVAPLIRAEIDPPRVVVGQAAKLRVSVFVPTWMSSPPEFPLVELVNAVTRLPPDSSFSVSETVDGDTWSGVVREYLVYPQLAGRYRLPASQVRVTYADPETRKPVVVDAAVPAVALQATVPDAARALEPFVPTAELRLEQTFSGALDALRAGDGITRTVVATASGLPSLFLPRLLSPGDAGQFRSYPEEARFEDIQKGRGGAYDGRRTERITYVFEAAGEYELPAVSVRWWNVDKRTIETASLPAVQVTISGAARRAQSAPGADSGLGWRERFRSVAAPVLGVLILALAVAWLFPRVRRRLSAYAERHRRSEAYRFRRALSAMEHGDGHAIVGAVTAWLEALAPGVTLEALEARLGFGALGAAMRPVYLKQYGVAADGALSPAERAALVSSATELRTEVAGRSAHAAQLALPALNPTASV